MSRLWEAQMDRVVAAFDDAHAFGRAKVTLQPSGRTFNVAVAETVEQKVRGMIGRRWQDDDFEALLFAYDKPTTVGFHMNGVLEQLYIAWFDEDGHIVDHVGMFTSDPYTYKAARPFKWVLEMPARDAREESWASWLDGQTITIEPA